MLLNYPHETLIFFKRDPRWFKHIQLIFFLFYQSWFIKYFEQSDLFNVFLKNQRMSVVSNTELSQNLNS